MYAFHNPSSEPFTLIFFKDINIAKVGEGSVICYQARIIPGDSGITISIANDKVAFPLTDGQDKSEYFREI